MSRKSREFKKAIGECEGKHISSRKYRMMVHEWDWNSKCQRKYQLREIQRHRRTGRFYMVHFIQQRLFEERLWRLGILKLDRSGSDE